MDKTLIYIFDRIYFKRIGEVRFSLIPEVVPCEKAQRCYVLCGKSLIGNRKKLVLNVYSIHEQALEHQNSKLQK